MNKKILLFIFSLLSSCAFADIPPTLCPSEINTDQNLTKPIEGWRLFNISSSHFLSQIEIYSGKPEDLAALKPDIQTNTKAIWHFDSGANPYVVCHYNDTTIQLTQALPTSVKKCTVWFQKYVQGSSSQNRPRLGRAIRSAPSAGGVPEKVLCE
jgi:hypothetical protein